DAVDERAVEIEDKRGQALGFLGFVHAEAVLLHSAIAFLRVDARVHLYIALGVVAARPSGFAFVFSQIVLENLAGTVLGKLVHAAVLPALFRRAASRGTRPGRRSRRSDRCSGGGS